MIYKLDYEERGRKIYKELGERKKEEREKDDQIITMIYHCWIIVKTHERE